LPLKASKAHIFTTVTPISVIPVPKFSESLPLSSYAFINAAPEPFFKDFQDQDFEKSQLSLWINKSSYLEHFVPTIIFSLSIL
jgi:hypothetical protein